MSYLYLLILVYGIEEIFGLEFKIFNNIYLEQFKIIIENIDNKNIIG